MPLRRDSNSRFTSTSHSNELQLFDLPPLRRALGILRRDAVKIEAPKGGLAKYSWNRKIRDYYRCKKCGCVTHYEYRKKGRNTTVAVNAVNFEPTALVGARIRHLDGAASWKFLD